MTLRRRKVLADRRRVLVMNWRRCLWIRRLSRRFWWRRRLCLDLVCLIIWSRSRKLRRIGVLNRLERRLVFGFGSWILLARVIRMTRNRLLVNFRLELRLKILLVRFWLCLRRRLFVVRFYGLGGGLRWTGPR